MDLILMMSYSSVNMNVPYCCQEKSNESTNNKYNGVVSVNSYENGISDNTCDPY